MIGLSGDQPPTAGGSVRAPRGSHGAPALPVRECGPHRLARCVAGGADRCRLVARHRRLEEVRIRAKAAKTPCAWICVAIPSAVSTGFRSLPASDWTGGIELARSPGKRAAQSEEARHSASSPRASSSAAIRSTQNACAPPRSHGRTRGRDDHGSSGRIAPSARGRGRGRREGRLGRRSSA